MLSLDDLPDQQAVAIARFALATWLSSLNEANTKSEVLALVSQFVAQLEKDELAAPALRAGAPDSPELRLMVVFFRAVSQRLSELLPAKR